MYIKAALSEQIPKVMSDIGQVETRTLCAGRVSAIPDWGGGD